MITNKRIVIDRPETTLGAPPFGAMGSSLGRPAADDSLLRTIEHALGADVIRWYISSVTSSQIVVEATFCADLEELPQIAHDRTLYPGKSAVLSIIPTGIGCSIGGYAGDATPANNLLAAVSDYLITNPNTVNASHFIHLTDNVVYAEGRAIDLFCRGQVDFHLPYGNRVGVIIEQTSEHGLDMVFNAVNAVRSIYGVDIATCLVTDSKIGSECQRNSDGAFVGTVRNPDVLFRACEAVIAKGATAIAITTDVQNLPAELYQLHFQGQSPNPVGGTEAVISHLVMKKFRVPAAHAPLLNFKDMDLAHGVVDARGAGEMVSPTGLASVLIGLSRSPQIQPGIARPTADIINRHNLLAVVIPASSLGGAPVLQAHALGIPVIAVKGNDTVLDVTHERLGLRNVVEVANYAEAAGILVALKNNINLESIARPLRTLRADQDEMEGGS